MSIVNKYNTIKGVSEESKHIAPLTGICSPEEFFIKYTKSDSEIMKRLRLDLYSIMNDVLWIKEANHENEAWAIDFVDALHTLSVQL